MGTVLLPPFFSQRGGQQQQKLFILSLKAFCDPISTPAFGCSGREGNSSVLLDTVLLYGPQRSNTLKEQKLLCMYQLLQGIEKRSTKCTHLLSDHRHLFLLLLYLCAQTVLGSKKVVRTSFFLPSPSSSSAFPVGPIIRFCVSVLLLLPL